MTAYRKISIFTYLFFSAILFSSCDNSLEDDKRYAEEKSIESYLSAKKLTYTKSNGVYLVVTKKSYAYEVNAGDTVEFWFKGYTPKTSSSVVFDTNIKSVAVDAGLDTNVRTFEPVRVIAGKTDLIEGVKRGLLLTRLNQKSTIIFTSDLGFKDEIVESLPDWSSLAYDLEIVYLNGPGIQQEKQLMSEMDLSGFTPDTSGLYYKLVVDTSGIRPSDGDVVYGSYQCSLPDNTVVYTVSTDTVALDPASDTLTSALKIGYTKVSVGGTVELIAPSPLCYGKNGNDKVNPYQPLLYTIRLDSIKSK
ncbi:MAG: FKBP-type peptidyl-prolyl cis-trans isomerase [Bacteroidales bacterium]